jgi:hypothetical protein
VHVAMPRPLWAVMLKTADRFTGGASDRLPGASCHFTSKWILYVLIIVEVGVGVGVGVGVSVGGSGVSVGRGESCLTAVPVTPPVYLIAIASAAPVSKMANRVATSLMRDRFIMAYAQRSDRQAQAVRDGGNYSM